MFSTSVTDARGTTTTTTYDTAGRAVAVTTGLRSDAGTAGGASQGSFDPDTTPDIATTYTRTGQPATITDATGTRTFAYEPRSGLIISESITGIYNKTLTRFHDISGRNAGYTIDNSSPVAYTYDSKGRLSNMTIDNGTPFSFNYDTAGVQTQITYPNNMTRTVTLEQNRNLIAKIETKVAGASCSGDALIYSYTYTNDAIARRGQMTRQWSGASSPTPEAITYQNNTRSEVNSAQSATNPSYSYQYQFDNIGNRITSTESGVNKSYTGNNLNQYTSISVAQSAETPSFDADGNQLELINSKGSWNLSYNAENRPVIMVSADTRVENTYDYMGRRVEKKVFQSGSGVPPLLTSHSRFVYDGYLQIKELNAIDNNAVDKSYTWDPTTGQATRPLVMKTASSIYYYTFDANKNITELTDSTGTIVSLYEYSPFGEAVIKSGALADFNPFRFSSEFHDDECGLVYYNYRHYNPIDGRWISRDPIGEECLGLYLFVNNFSTGLGDLSKKILDLLKGCKCMPDAEKSKYAIQIQNAVVLAWTKNYLNNIPHSRGTFTENQNVIGGYLCYNWARIFIKAIEDLKIPCVNVSIVRRLATMDGKTPRPQGDIHAWVLLEVCGKCDKKLFIDNGSGFVHDTNWIPTATTEDGDTYKYDLECYDMGRWELDPFWDNKGCKCIPEGTGN